MPAKNRNKVFFANGFYHIYNRGVEKREIFQDDQDYLVFLHFLKKYLSPSPPAISDPTKIVPLISMDLHDEIDLLAYCLMPNHFHLLLQQKMKDSMTKLLRRVTTAYVLYFNLKYKRVGPLFQGIYKAVAVDNENYLTHLSRYIHLNPIEINEIGRDDPLEGPTSTRSDLIGYRWSSYLDYLGERKTEWVKTDLILSYFKKAKSNEISLRDFNSYQGFVENSINDPRGIIGNLTLD